MKSVLTGTDISYRQLYIWENQFDNSGGISRAGFLRTLPPLELQDQAVAEKRVVKLNRFVKGSWAFSSTKDFYFTIYLYYFLSILPLVK